MDKEIFCINAARNHLLSYVTLMNEGFQTPAHIKLIAKHLHMVESGEITRLIINMPPRGGKSTIASQYFPTWFLGRNPNMNIIFATYGQNFAEDFGRNVRNIMRDERYKATFPNSTLADDSASIKKLSLDKGGSYFAVGAGSSITGRGADCAIIDDPLKNRADANSPTIRKNIIDWYKSTLYTRLTPTGKIIIIQTRWSEGDLSGYLLATEPENWTVLNIPAINDEGESYWPDRWPVERLEEIKRSIGSYEWAALYQQSPAPQDGGIFNRNWFETVKAVPSGLKSVRYWDRAASVAKDGSDPDYTVGIKMAKDKDGIIYIEDMRRFRGSSLEVQNTIKNVASQDGVGCRIGLEQDPGQAGKSEVEYLIRILQGYNVRAFPVRKDKVTRSLPFSAQAEAGNVKLVRAPWNEDLLQEVEIFPFGKHDDIIDSLSGAFGMIVEPSLNFAALTKW